MKKKIFVIMVCMVTLGGATVGALEIQNGLMGYQWGDSVANYPGLEKLGDKGEVSYYRKPGEVYTIGEEMIEKVIYGFHRDQLFGIYLHLDSIAVYDNLFNHLKAEFGLPSYKEAAGGDKPVFKWKDQDVTIKLKMEKPAGKLKLAFYYRPISTALNSSQWEELDTSSFRFIPFEKGKEREKFILFEF